MQFSVNNIRCLWIKVCISYSQCWGADIDNLYFMSKIQFQQSSIRYIYIYIYCFCLVKLWIKYYLVLKIFRRTVYSNKTDQVHQLWFLLAQRCRIYRFLLAEACNKNPLNYYLPHFAILDRAVIQGEKNN